MLSTKYSKDRRNRLSESKQAQRKESTSKGATHNRSSSLYRNKRPERLQTDYAQYDNPHTTNISHHPHFHHKASKRRDTYECTRQEAYAPPAVHSTKHNPRKNIQIKSLFRQNGYRQTSVSKKQKGTLANHPLLKFMGKKYTQPKRESFCAKPARQQRHSSVHSNDYSLSIERHKKQSLNKKPQLSINKHQISLRTQTHDNTKDRKAQRTVGERQPKQEEVKKDCEWTMKTVKKQKGEEEKADKLKNQESVRSSQSYGLTEEEEETFGDRFPYGFEKSRLLGRGGFSLVWLGKHIKSGRQFAIKQIITQNTHQTHLKQIWFGTLFFSLGGVPKPEFTQFPGIKNLARLYSYEINQNDTWIFYQKCGQSLGSALYDIRSERLYGQQKLYKIHYKTLYREMAARPKLLLELIVQICRALALLSECEVVHSDLKTENILLKVDGEGSNCQLKDLKLIDYGSSFEFRNLAQFSMATPQYMPPEILNYIIHENGGEYEEELYQQVMTDYRQPWAVDMWSLGCVILQIVVGVPLWMSLPLLVPGKNGAWLQKEGFFAVKGRLFPEIIKKQRSVNPHLQTILERDNYSGIVLSGSARRVICRMLEVDFNNRISPQEVIEILEKEMA